MLPVQSSAILNSIGLLHASPWKAVISATGAGVGLQGVLWSVPGSSNTLLSAFTPYERIELVDFIGREPQQFCSRDTALWMAAASYRRAYSVVVRGGGNAPVMGVGITAAVGTSTPKKGEHRVYVAVRTPSGAMTISATLTKGRLERVDEGRICDLLGLGAMLAVAGIEQPGIGDCGIISDELVPKPGTQGEFVVSPKNVEPLARDLADLYKKPLIMPDGSRHEASVLDPGKQLLFPGSFAPLHYGHLAMADQAERMTGREVVFTINGKHPQKGEISEGELLRRADQFRWHRPVLFTEWAPLYVDKAAMFPGFGFLVGADAMISILDPQYYGGTDGRDGMLRRLAENRARLFVVGRHVGDRFMTLDDIDVPEFARPIVSPVSGRWDVRSRDLR